MPHGECSMARINIYIPNDMRNALEKRRDINLSAICQRAIAAELAKPYRDMIVLSNAVPKVRMRPGRKPKLTLA